MGVRFTCQFMWQDGLPLILGLSFQYRLLPDRQGPQVLSAVRLDFLRRHRRNLSQACFSLREEWYVSQYELIGGLDWRFGFGFEPRVLVEGKWETIP